MKHFSRPFALCAAFFCSSLAAQAVIMMGDVAIVGKTDDRSPDIFAFVTLAPIAAGEVLYFTDNGWTGSGYRGVTVDDADGNETAVKWQSNASIPAGTIIGSGDTSPTFTWTFSGLIPASGTSTGAWEPLALTPAGEQINIVQKPSSLVDPFLNATSIYAFDDTGAFEPATTASTGGIPTGLSLASNTAVTLGIVNGNNASGFNFLAFNKNSLSSGTKSEWLAAIANPANWTGASSSVGLSLPSGTINVIPEPITAMTALFGATVLFSQRRRRQN